MEYVVRTRLTLSVSAMAQLAVFFVVAVAGFRLNLWLVVFAPAAHDVFDFFHKRLPTNPSVPTW
jgi:hypothetical protein